MAEKPLALVFTSLLLALKSSAILAESWFQWRNIPVKTSKVVLQILAALMGCFALVLGSVAVSLNPNIPPDSNNPCTRADADIVGDGVRTATWVQVGLLAFIAIIGSFHRGRSAVQEVGAGLVVTHIALAIALLVPMHMKKLSPVDSILGTITLDAQNVALSIQLISKQTLAARWQTYIVIFGQLAGLVAIGVLIQNFAKNHLATDSLVTETCECVSVYWWGWLNNCSTPAGKDHRSIWAYYALRLVTAIHCWVISILKTSPFDKAKRREEASPCEQCAKCRDGETRPGDKRHENCRCDVCVNCNQCNKCNKTYYHCCNDTCSHNDCAQCPRKRKFQDRDGFVGKQKYSQMSASLSLMFFEYSVYALLSLLAAESLLKSYQIQPSSPWSAIGQVTSTVIAVSTALRFLWVFGSLFWKEGVALV